MKVIRKIKSNINHSSDGVKDGRHHSAGATVTRASAGVTFHPNSIRGVINKTTPRTASLVLLPSLAVLAMFLVSFVTAPNNVYADDDDGVSHPGSLCPPGEENCSDSDTGTDTTTEPSTTSSPTLTIEDAKNIGIKLSSEAIVLDISPTSSGVFKSESFTVDVSTNNSAGYNLTMTASGTSLSRTTPVNGATPTIPTIPTGKTFTEATFETGYWGYKLGTDTNYLPMTTEVIPINTTKEAANSSVNTITFASKLDNSIPSGTYSGITLSFIATTNPDPVNYMQNISATKLAELMPNTNDFYTLRDSRDDTDYVVAKLADGKYWMLDNLALDIANASVQSKLSPSTTNATAQSLSCLITGKYNNAACTSPYAVSAVSGSYSESYTSAVIDANYVDVIPENSTAGNGNHKTGVFYNYCAASAGSICHSTTSAIGGISEAIEDICPSGWRVPTRSTYDALIDADSDYITTLSLPRAGYYDGELTLSGRRAYIWTSSMANSSYYAYADYMMFGGPPSDGGGSNLYKGYTVRCVFKTS